MSPARVLLHDFQSQPPGFRLDQGAILAWLAAAHAQAELTLQQPATSQAREAILHRYRKLVLRFGCSTDRIAFRNSCLDDFTHTDWDRMKIFPLPQHPSGRSCGARSRFFSEACGAAFERFYPDDLLPPAVLIHVTCTGYVSPSGAQRLVAQRGWGEGTEVVHAYHMGCYASMPAIRIAAGFVARGKPRVDLVHTELCTLHLDPGQHLPEQLVVQTLFADGLIRYSVSKDGGDGGRGLEVLTTREEIAPGTEDAMTWMASDFGMHMTLSRKVPDHLRSALKPFLERLATGADLTVAQLTDQALWAIHPGGPRIIDELQELLGLRPAQVQASNAILGNHGNMSSATLPHVWRSMLEDGEVPGGALIVSLAFGPGLTLAGAILRKAS